MWYGVVRLLLQAMHDETPVIAPETADKFLSAQECQKVWNYQVRACVWVG